MDSSKFDNNKESENKTSSTINRRKVVKEKINTTSHVSTAQLTCPLCKQNHYIYYCEAFLKLSIPMRSEEIKKLELCYNCLRPKPSAKHCKLNGCKKCNRKHNTLLHISESNEVSGLSNSSDFQSNAIPTTTVAHSAHQTYSNILLSTAIIEVSDNEGGTHHCRVLLDSGSQSHFVTQRLCGQLNLPCTKVNIPVSGILSNTTHIKSKAVVTVKSRFNSFKVSLSCLVITKITDVIPTVPIDTTTVEIPNNIELADPKFYQSSEIDLLMGAGIFWDLVRVGQIKLKGHAAVLQKSVFGWVISGQLITKRKTKDENPVTCNFSKNLEEQIELFWKQEECTVVSKKLSKEEQLAEDTFRTTIKRNSDGRFVVTIPLKSDLSNLGSTYDSAKLRLLAMERKFKRNPEIAVEYIDFMNEYSQLGHMSQVNLKENNLHNQINYLPHHCVKKEGSNKSLRVVFDGSVKSSTGKSFNEINWSNNTRRITFDHHEISTTFIRRHSRHYKNVQASFDN